MDKNTLIINLSLWLFVTATLFVDLLLIQKILLIVLFMAFGYFNWSRGLDEGVEIGKRAIKSVEALLDKIKEVVEKKSS